jgi:NADPH-dependent 2,4-dienoyl-CoA reductase/sulfur reductase-like enzyme
VLVAIGVTPSAGMLRGGTRQRDGSVEVDAYLRIADEVYAAGDIAAFPDPRSGKRVRIEHWRLAEQLGRNAAMNMLGKKQKFTAVPFFWTEQCGQRIDYAGFAPAWDQVLVHGEPEKFDYIAYYIQDGKILAASACRRDRQIIAFMHLLETGRLPTPDKLRAEDIDLTRLLN